MKKSIYILFFALLLPFIAKAQQVQIELDGSNGQTYEQAFAQAMARLNTSRVPYGALYERTMGWSNTWGWQSGDTTDFSQLKQTWRDMQYMLLNTPPDTYTSMLANAEKAISGNQIPVLCINAGFGYIDTAAIRDGRMRVENNQLVDAGGTSPYGAKQVCIAGLATADVAPGVNYTFVANAGYQFSNIPGETVQQYIIQEIANPEQYILPATGSISFSFLWGRHVQYLHITVQTNMATYQVVQRINVVYDDATAPRSANADEPEHQLLTSDIAFQGYDESAPSISHADYHIYYHYKSPTNIEAEKVLKKPIVILDGFDPKDERNYKKLYDEKLKFGNQYLGEELRKKGYDVVILNFPMTGSTPKEMEDNGNIYIPLINGMRRDGGTDYIERNAFLLVKLIQTLNAKLAQNGSADSLVIVGPSMGGQISRYALAYMEKQGMDHRTRIWLSFDSPHLGANISPAVQMTLYFFGKLAGQQEALKAYKEQLHTPAARQMLIEQLDGFNGSAFFYQKYYTALNSNGLLGSGGWPQNAKRLALVNGAGNGATNGIPCSDFLNLKGKLSIIDIISFSNRFIPATGQNCNYFSGSFSLPKLVFFFGFLWIKFKTERNIINNNTHGSMDVAPGGIFNVQEYVKGEFSKSLDKMGVKQSWDIKKDQCFIPTVSGLAIKNNDFTWNTAITEELIKQKGIPFNNYFIPTENQEHVSLTQESVTWLMNQLDGNYYNVIKKAEIRGSSPVCSTATYSVENVPSNSTLTWTCSSNLALASNTGLNAVFSRMGTTDGAGWVQANVSYNGQHIGAVKKDVWVGAPAGGIPNMDNGTQFYGGMNESFTLEAPDMEGINYYYWHVSRGTIIQGQGSKSIIVRFPTKASGYFSVEITYGNNCGQSRLYKSGNFIGGELPERYILYPNPATAAVTLKISEDLNAASVANTSDAKNNETPAIKTVTIMDMMGNVVRRQKCMPATKETQIKVSGLVRGIYLVVVNENTPQQQTLKLAVSN